ncbi:polysaccharide deacetylase family protein [Mucilaginibacter pedocola]|uniref:Polysaccharide deacetylase n=1 Tax=Mucilaginibacter pedocola TaxID=1792845 RepID=A0A1S9PE05_9SPHI|nr:polysaccharide deacetylase [Mucilaginibacter pedocola]OOQ58818.1 polysaccharide deacetylase [Mucilaginibacter pedocola]
MPKLYLKILSLFLMLMAFCCRALGQSPYTPISNYRVYTGVAKGFGLNWVVLRSFENRSRQFLLLVNPQTMETRIDLATSYTVTPLDLEKCRSALKNTPYTKALAGAEKQSAALQDAGIETGLPKETGISLTADLCPSHRPLDRRIFTDIINGFKKVERPVPVALSVSGLWMLKHKPDLQWLKQLEQQHEIDITWINHSYNHRVSAKAPLKENFLLEPGTDMNYEVLQTEQAMIINGLLPSVFFRFPGLVSDQQLIYRITGFGLMPIGTDAWLAKGQQPHAGSIVLIHGNGNEPTGVADFIKLLGTKASAIAQKQWLLYDLRQTVDEDFESN